MVEQVNQESICSRKKKKNFLRKTHSKARVKMHNLVVGVRVVSPRKKGYNKRVRKQVMSPSQLSRRPQLPPPTKINN